MTTTTTTSHLRLRASAASQHPRSNLSSPSAWTIHGNQTSILSFLHKRCPPDSAPASQLDITMVASRSHPAVHPPSYPRFSRRAAGLPTEPSAPATKSDDNTAGPAPTRRTSTRRARGIQEINEEDSQPAAKRLKVEHAPEASPSPPRRTRRPPKHVTIVEDGVASEKEQPTSNLRGQASRSNFVPGTDTKGKQATTQRQRRTSTRAPVEPSASHRPSDQAAHGPLPAPQEIEKRKLRSQDGGSRFKSDLALFFPSYDEIISNEPQTQEFLTPNTKIYVADEEIPKASQRSQQPSTPAKPDFAAIPTNNVIASPNSVKGDSSIAGWSPSSAPYRVTKHPRLYNTQRVDFSSIEKAAGQQGATEDPLGEAFYVKAHNRAERREKQLRNIEKNKAQHEKDNLERLLDGLKGHDWLRVMGISGITDSEKKEYEPKRDYFVREVSALLAKFKAWREEEKRRKIEKEQALLAEEEEEEEAAEAEEAEDAEEGAEQEEEEKVQVEVDAANTSRSSNDSPNSSELDRRAASQLHQEATSASSRRHHGPTGHEESSIPFPYSQSSPPPKPFTSFFSKPYLRDAAVGKHRRSGRSVSAFGHPIPETVEDEFELPHEILTPEARTANARSKRRMRRASKDG